jgi:hypothetical protein
LKIAYIAGAYRSETISGTVKNIRAAEYVAIKYWKKGYAVICPHKNTALFDGLMPDKTWLDGDIEILKRCDVIVMMQGWEDSTGSKAEHFFALRNGIEIIYDIGCS